MRRFHGLTWMLAIALVAGMAGLAAAQDGCATCGDATSACAAPCGGCAPCAMNCCPTAPCRGGCGPCANYGCWHGGYYGAGYCAPVALVVPPGVATYTEFGYDMGGTQVRRVCPQFQRGYPMSYYEGAGCSSLRPTPNWPTSTTQFGVYYVRAPW